jgi:integrase
MGRRRSNAQPPNFRARKQKSGRIYYYFDTGAKPRKEIPLGPNLSEALVKYAELRSVEWEAPKSRPPTFADAAELYLVKVIPTKARRTQIGNQRELKWLLKFFNDPPGPLDLITPRHVSEYLAWRKDAPARANREKALLSHIFNKAREWGLTNAPNPCAGIKGFKESGRTVYIEDDVYQAVYRESAQVLKDAMDAAYLTAQRPSDVVKLQQTDVVTYESGERGLRVKQDKTGKNLTLTLSDKGTNELNTLGKLVQRLIDSKKTHKRPTHALFCTKSGQPITQSALAQRFSKARKRAVDKALESAAAASSALERQKLMAFAKAVKQFQFRDLRAKAGTDKASATGDMRQAQLQLGHASLGMTEDYVRRRGGDRIEPTK